MQGRLGNLKDLCECFEAQNGRVDENRLITIPGCNAFACTGAVDCREEIFQIRMTSSRFSRFSFVFSVFSSTIGEAMRLLEFIYGLPDNHFTGIYVLNRAEAQDCPFEEHLLELMLQNATRRQVMFENMTFTPDQSNMLASFGTITNIEFCWCEFQDGGRRFVETLAARQEDEDWGVASVSVSFNLMFSNTNLALLPVDTLEVSFVEVNADSLGALSSARVQLLKFGDECQFVNGLDTLVEAIEQGCCSRGLGMDVGNISAQEERTAFVASMLGNTHLTRLNLSGIQEQQTMQDLAAVFTDNNRLVHLALESWCNCNDVLEAVSVHPYLLSLDLTIRMSDQDERRSLTETVANMLSVNTQIEAMTFCNATFDEDIWNKKVVPRLDCNKYSKRSPSIQTIEDTSTKAGVLARALAEFSSKPHLVLMLLNQNQGIISIYLQSAPDAFLD